MGIFSGYMICSDLDGTIVVSEDRVPQNNIEAIRYFKENGGMFVVATGRGVAYMERYKDKFISDRYTISGNGNILYNIEENRPEKVISLNEKAQSAVREICEEFYDILKEVRINGVYDVIKYEADKLDTVGEAFEQFDNIVCKAVFVFKEEENAKRVQEILTERYGKDYEYMRTWATGLEMWSKGAGKGLMLRELKKRLPHIHTVISCGDFENDVSMFKESDLSYAPAGACKEALDAASVKGVSVKDGLIAQVVRELELQIRQSKNGG